MSEQNRTMAKRRGSTMKVQIVIGLGLGLAMWGVAGARGISTDTGQYDLTPFTGTSAAVTYDGYTLSFAPGTSTTSAAGGPIDPAYQGAYPSAEFNWGPNPTSNSSADDIIEQVKLAQTSANEFTVDFNYLSGACALETGTFSLGSFQYASKNPCGNANSSAASNEFDVVVSNGKVAVTAPLGWEPVGTVAAPEIDPNSAFAGLTLLFGTLAIIGGRRKLAGAKSA